VARAGAGRADPEFSAGGVVLDPAADPPACLVIVPTRRAADGSKVLALPKGHPDPGETPAQAATREVREETGIEAELGEELGDVRYFYQRGGRRIAKVVRFFLMTARGGSMEDHDHEVEDVRWMELGAAAAALSYPGEREMVGRALSALGTSG
jgi:8-oxo-dGTP pyrophosphatase MutT (NUDIX family)